MELVANPQHQRPECFRLALGDARGRLIEAQHGAPDAMRHASSTTRRVPVDSSLMNRSTKEPSPRNAMTSSASLRAMRCQA